MLFLQIIKILKLAKKYGADCWYLKFKKLSNDYASKVDIIIDTLVNAENIYDYIDKIMDCN